MLDDTESQWFGVIMAWLTSHACQPIERSGFAGRAIVSRPGEEDFPRAVAEKITTMRAFGRHSWAYAGIDLYDLEVRMWQLAAAKDLDRDQVVACLRQRDIPLWGRRRGTRCRLGDLVDWFLSDAEVNRIPLSLTQVSEITGVGKPGPMIERAGLPQTEHGILLGGLLRAARTGPHTLELANE